MIQFNIPPLALLRMVPVSADDESELSRADFNIEPDPANASYRVTSAAGFDLKSEFLGRFFTGAFSPLSATYKGLGVFDIKDSRLESPVDDAH